MQIARPPSGFKFVELPLATQTLATARNHCPWLDQAYANVKERLRLAGHRVGFMVKDKVTRRYFPELDPATGEVRLVVAYHVLGDTITIYGIKVSMDLQRPTADGQ